MPNDPLRSWAKTALLFVAAPLAIYLCAFGILTFPLIARFSTHVWGSAVDGSVNVWNIWWVTKAVADPELSVWSTSYLFHPGGTSLLLHSLGPINGFMALAFTPFLTLVQTHNLLLILTFALAGLTAFWLAYRVTGSYAGALVGGFVFSFCPYHFAHAAGHLQICAIQFLPLFVLAWVELLERPRPAWAALAAAALGLNLLATPYYLCYAVLAGAVLYAARAWGRREPFFLFTRSHLPSLGVFIALSLAAVLPFAIAYWRLDRADPILGEHPPELYTMDLFAPFIPGVSWRLNHLTEYYWAGVTDDWYESCVFVGLSVLAAAGFAVYRRDRENHFDAAPWIGFALFFGVMALGPSLSAWGMRVPGLVMPYRLLEFAFPPIKEGGLPSRLMIMVMLALSVLAAEGVRRLAASPSPRRRALLAAGCAWLVFEYLPSPEITTEVAIPSYVEFLRDASPQGAVIDRRSLEGSQMLYQTVHGRPIAWGMISRINRGTRGAANRLRAEVDAAIATGNLSAISDRGDFRYLVLGSDQAIDTPAARGAIVYRDPETVVYDLAKPSEAP